MISRIAWGCQRPEFPAGINESKCQRVTSHRDLNHTGMWRRRLVSIYFRVIAPSAKVQVRSM